MACHRFHPTWQKRFLEKDFFLKIVIAAIMLTPSSGVKGQDSVLTASLYTMDLQDLMNIVVTSASKKEENSFDAPLSVTAITAEEIRKSGVTTLEELFRLVPGLIVREEVNGNFDLHIRGLDNVPPGNFSFFSENQLTLVMIDGMKVYNQMNGGTFWEALPISLTEIERIEIIRGPSTALYGPNAASGVINIITKKTLAKEGLNFMSSVVSGTQSTNVLNGTLGYQKNRCNLMLSGTLDERSRFEETFFDYLVDGYVPADSLRDYQEGGTPQGTAWADQRWPERDFAKFKNATTLKLNYALNEEDFIDVTVGSQFSRANTVFMESTTTPLVRRQSRTQQANLRANIRNFKPQLSFLRGRQNIYLGADNQEYDLRSLDAGLEYEYTGKKLTLRPGLIYQWSEYDDTDYRTSDRGGIINGTRQLANLGLTLRSDLQLTDDLRMILAMRGDRFRYPDDLYLTYQFISTYSLNDYHLIRGVASRSNRGPFIADVHTNFFAGGIQFQGNRDIKLPVMQMFELGYRGKINSHLQVDVEIFHSNTSDFVGLEFSEVVVNQNSGQLELVYDFRNYPTMAIQNGITGKITYVHSEKLKMELFATIQGTTIEDFERDTLRLQDPLPGEIPPFPVASTDTVPTLDHTGTPRFFGGFTLDFSPKDKWNFWLNGYFHSKQTETYAYLYPEEARNPEFDIPAKLRFDAKVAYTLWKENAIFLNARNLLNTRTPEFGFAERIGGLYLVGMDLRF